jgi:hypothetical protein
VIAWFVWAWMMACGHWIDCSTAALDPDTQMAIIRAARSAGSDGSIGT